MLYVFTTGCLQQSAEIFKFDYLLSCLLCYVYIMCNTGSSLRLGAVSSELLLKNASN